MTLPEQILDGKFFENKGSKVESKCMVAPVAAPSSVNFDVNKQELMFDMQTKNMKILRSSGSDNIFASVPWFL